MTPTAYATPTQSSAHGSSSSCARTSAETGAVQQEPSPEMQRARRELRLTGIVEAIHSSKVMVPQIVGQNGRLTLTRWSRWKSRCI